MNKSVSKFRFLLLVVTMLLAIVFTSQSRGAFDFRIVSSFGPTPDTVSYNESGGYSDAVTKGLGAGNSPGSDPGTASPPWWWCSEQSPITWEMLSGGTPHVWRGITIVNPESFRYDEYGTLSYANVAITSTDKFNLQDVSYQVTSSDPAHSLNSSGSFGSEDYGVGMVGQDYGPDGIANTADDVIYGPDNPMSGNALVNALFLVGPPVGYNLEGLPFDYARDYINSVGSFDFTVSYLIDGYSASQTMTVVPEPATLLILGSGVLALIRRRRPDNLN